MVVTVLLASIIYLISFVNKHPEIISQIKHIPLSLAAFLLAAYLIFFIGLALINTATLKLCNIRAGFLETILLTAYTAIINFFGPLQSGPAFRAIYLKKRYSINLKDYAAATLAYYFFYAVFSITFLMFGIFKFWAPLLVLLGFVGVWVLGKLSPYFRDRVNSRWQKLNGKAWLFLGIATLVQVTATFIIFFLELKNIAPATNASQAIIYTGAANLALFVSITPAAIGFRETFLLFSRNLHHISSSTIVAANLIDRSIYVVVLVVLAVFVFGSHANKLLKKRATS